MSRRKNIIRQRFLLATSYIIIILLSCTSSCAHQKTVSAFSTHSLTTTPHRQTISTITGRRKIRIKALSTEQEISLDDEIGKGSYNNDSEIQQEEDAITTQHNTQNYSNGILSSVKLLARIAGSAGNDLVSDPNNIGSSSRLGMAFSKSSKQQQQLAQQQQATTSRRSQLIEWQRTNLRKKKDDNTLITTALETLERDMALLDNVASQQSQLSGTEVGLLAGAVVASGMGPIVFPGTSVTELLKFYMYASASFLISTCFVLLSSINHKVRVLLNYWPRLLLHVSILCFCV